MATQPTRGDESAKSWSVGMNAKQDPTAAVSASCAPPDAVDLAQREDGRRVH